MKVKIMLSEENREHLYNFDSAKLNFKRYLEDLPYGKN